MLDSARWCFTHSALYCYKIPILVPFSPEGRQRPNVSRALSAAVGCFVRRTPLPLTCAGCCRGSSATHRVALHEAGSGPYALTYASTDKARVGALISAPAFWKQQVARFRSTSALDRGQAERRLEGGDDDIKQESGHAPVADRA